MSTKVTKTNSQPNEASKYWLDSVVSKVANALESQPANSVAVVSSGITPSGPYHVGHAREILTADALYRGLAQRGVKVRHLHFVDAFDALRKRYAYLPERYEQEAGKPVYLIPAPDGMHKNYAQQYFSSYSQAAELLGVDMEILWTEQEYMAGKYADIIVQTLQARDQIASILERISGRGVEEDWQPIQILDETTNSLRTAEYISFDAILKQVTYRADDGSNRVADMRTGQVKLDWRCDWPARWKLFGVTVEGFGREHATKGGSYDTGKAIMEEVYGGVAPIPVPYDTINLKGDTKKMSSSLGNLVTIQEALQIIPPEILRFFVFKSLPQKQIFFDPGVGLYNLFDEVAKIESAVGKGLGHEFQQAWRIAQLDPSHTAVVEVPFSHLVTAYQTAQGDFDRVTEILVRTGHSEVVEKQSDALKRELVYVSRWIKDYAPDNVKFSLIEPAPQTPSADGRSSEFILELLRELKAPDSTFSSEEVHASIYEAAAKARIESKQAFSILYQVFFGQPAGPRLGYFITSLGKQKTLAYLETALQK